MYAIRSYYETVNEYVKVLADIRNLRGRIVSLRDLRYTNLLTVEALENSIKTKNDDFTKKCIDFMIKPEGLKIYSERVEELQKGIETVNKSKEGRELSGQMDGTSFELELV